MADSTIDTVAALVAAHETGPALVTVDGDVMDHDGKMMITADSLKMVSR